LEEREYPTYYYQIITDNMDDDLEMGNVRTLEVPARAEIIKPQNAAEEKHLTFEDNQRGVTYEKLFGPWLKDAKIITITDPYVRQFYQIRNVMEVLEVIAAGKPLDEMVDVHLVTIADDRYPEKQNENLANIAEAAPSVGINFTWDLASSGSIHARHIITDTGWKITLDRGLDFFQQFEMNDTFTFANRLQQFRRVRAFEVTYLRVEE
jgi:ATP-dependent Lon protease